MKLRKDDMSQQNTLRRRKQIHVKSPTTLEHEKHWAFVVIYLAKLWIDVGQSAGVRGTNSL